MENIQDLIFSYDTYDSGCNMDGCCKDSPFKNCEWFSGCELKVPIGNYEVGDWVPCITWNSKTLVLTIFDWADPETGEDYGEPQEFDLSFSFIKRN